jgi:uncharacterized protein YcbX
VTPVIGGLYIYPVKSAAGIACDSVQLGAHGLLHDREWMIVDSAGRFLTQREEARLALLGTAILDTSLRLTLPSGATLTLPLAHGGERAEVQVWNSRCGAFDAGSDAAAFISDWLGRPLRLVRFDTSRLRLSNRDWTDGREVSTLFSDGYPLLVLSRASIADLAARVGHDLPVERFRPNVLLDGVPAYGEDAVSRLGIGPVTLQLTKACTRCAITTIDHKRGKRTGDEPLRTLKSYRFDKALRGVVFGRNAYAIEGVGSTLTRDTPVSIIPA